jgi:hypothetical protein
MAPSHNYFARLWLVSACFVVAISFLPPSDLNYDLTIQLQARSISSAAMACPFIHWQVSRISPRLTAWCLPAL